jgi:ABC-type multidrug transport system fused ATPase/permease subunit
MDILMFIYVILTGTVTAIVAEETRDPRYFPLIVLCFFTVFGIILLFNPWLIPSYLDLIRIALAALTLITVAFFIRDLRKIVKIQRGSMLCLKHANEFYEIKLALRSSAEEFRRVLEEKIEKISLLSEELRKTIEGMKNG